MLVVTRKKGQSIMIGDDIEIIVSKLDDGSVKLGISAPSDMDILRKELYEAIKSENKEAMEMNLDFLKNLKNNKMRRRRVVVMNINSIRSLNQISDINSTYYIDNDLNKGMVIEKLPFIEGDMAKDVKGENEKELNKEELQNKFDKKELDKSLKKLNRFLEDESAHAEYSVHKELNTIMIKIIDDKTKDVILEVPPKKILDMIASMCKQFGLIDKRA